MNFKQKKFMSLILAIMMVLQVIMPLNGVIAQADDSKYEQNGVGIQNLTPEKIGLAVGGPGITEGKGFNKNVYYLTETELEQAKQDKSLVIGETEVWENNKLYSSHHNHGEHVYVYRNASGLNVKNMMGALGANTSGNVEIEGTDGAFKGVADDVFNRYYIKPDGTKGEIADPFIALYESVIDTKNPGEDTVVPTSSEQEGKTFIFGQKEATEDNNCLYVKGVNKIRFGRDLPSFTLKVGDKTHNMPISDIVNLGVYETQYSYTSNNETKTHSLKGIPLTKLLKHLGVEFKANDSLSLTASDGYKTRPITISNVDESFLAFDGNWADGGRISDNDTPLRIYRPGQFGNEVVIKNVTGGEITSTPVEEEEPTTPDDGKKQANQGIEDSVFYVAVEDKDGTMKYYYYSKEELKSLQKEQKYEFINHGQAQIITTIGASVSDLLTNLSGVEISDDMIVQYAELDGFHATNSGYKDSVESLTNVTTDNSGATKNPSKAMVSWGINEHYPNGEEASDKEGEFKSPEPEKVKSEHLRGYRDTGVANSAVLKSLIGVVVSKDGTKLTKDNTITVNTVSDQDGRTNIANGINKNDPTKPIEIKGLVEGMKYKVIAPKAVNGKLSASEKDSQIVTVEKGMNQEVTFKYTENTFISVKDLRTDSVKNYTYTDLFAQGIEVPNKGDYTGPYGYEKPWYRKYSGVYLSELLKNSETDVEKVTLVGKDGNRVEVSAKDMEDYFVAYSNLESSRATNLKTRSVVYNDAKIILPKSAEVISGKENTDYEEEGKPVDVAIEKLASIEIETSNHKTWTGSTVTKDIAADKEWKVNFNKAVDLTTVDANLFIVDKETGDKFETKPQASEDGKTVELKLPVGKTFTSGKTYVLYVNQDVKNTDDQKTLKNGVKMEFEIK